MGCDNHLHTEIKAKGKWLHYSAPESRRDYELFNKMAGVRHCDGDEDPISLPRGLPDDATDSTRFMCEKLGDYGHSHSWLSAAEIAKVEDWWESNVASDSMRCIETELCGFLFAGSWGDFVKNSTDDYQRHRSLGLEDVRWVFWFDN